MADGTAIEWTDATWNVVNGCSVISPGCTNCYAMRLAGTRLKHHPSRAGLTVDTKAGPVWNGQVRFNDAVMRQPLQWKRPRRIFVCAHGDLFHDAVPDAVIDQVFAVMALAPQHQFQVLTKRAQRMRDYLTGLPQRIADWACDSGLDFVDLPLANVWLGVSVEDQVRADERVPLLLDTPAAVRWLSCEPLLGPVDLRTIELRPFGQRPTDLSRRLGDYVQPLCGNFTDSPKIDWVVAGGESGPGARPMHPDWARALRDQCAAAQVPFLFKQWGSWLPGEVYAEGDQGGFARCADGQAHGGRPTHWWDGDAFGGQISVDVGKKAAGRMLDGVTHDGFPA
jgi:protein gp37